MGTGLVVTSLIGASINPTTGDYSRGASGFWVENGAIVRPVNECTIAGNLRAMLDVDPPGQRRPAVARARRAEPAGRGAGHCRKLTAGCSRRRRGRPARSRSASSAGPNPVREKPGGHGPVSDADLAVDRQLRETLLAARPGYGWLSEESEDGPARLARDARLRRRPDRRHPRLPRRPEGLGAVAGRRRGRPAGRRGRAPAGARPHLCRRGRRRRHPRRRADRVGAGAAGGGRARARPGQRARPEPLARRPAAGRAPLPPVARLPALPGRRGPLRRHLQLPRHLGVGRRRRRPDRPRGRRRR